MSRPAGICTGFLAEPASENTPETNRLGRDLPRNRMDAGSLFTCRGNQAIDAVQNVQAAPCFYYFVALTRGISYPNDSPRGFYLTPRAPGRYHFNNACPLGNCLAYQSANLCRMLFCETCSSGSGWIFLSCTNNR